MNFKTNSLLILLIIGVYSCSEKKTTFTLSKEIVKMTLNYNTNNTFYFSDIIVRQDTIKVGIDTGCSYSTFPYLDSAEHFIKTESISDFRGVNKTLSKVRIKQIDWGGLRIKNLNVCKSDELGGISIIGEDILKQFCVKFDNYNKKILLSSNSNLIKKKGIKIPFKLTSNGMILLKLQLGNKENIFQLDIGYGGEFMVDSTFFYTSKLVTSKQKKWYGKLTQSVFTSDSILQNEIIYKTISNCDLGGKRFKNVTVTYNPNFNLKNNYIGNLFLRRFSSFTIDYLNQYLYLELPKDIEILSKDIYNQKDTELIFSNKEIKEYPIEYLNELYRFYNSFGFRTSYISPFVINEIEIGSPNTIQLSIGDTLVGINKKIFSKSVFQKLKNKSNYQLNLNIKKQQNQLVKTMFRTKKAYFHFLKNGKMITVKAKRSQFLNPPPFVGYAFQFQMKDLLYYGDMNFYVDYKAKKMSYHFPWQTLSGREIKVRGFDDKNENISLTNNLQK